jgi:6-phosphofructokinase 1
VDNDLQVTEYCMGFDSAVAVVTEAVERLHTTAASHHCLMGGEAMGREAGWVNLMGGLARGADMIVIPEVAVELSVIIDHLLKRHQAGKNFSTLAGSEGAEVGDLRTPCRSREPLDAFGHVQLSHRGIGERLGRQLETDTGVETRVTILGPSKKGGTPDAHD